MLDEDQDKTEEATPYKLEEARKRGEVAKSAEITSTVVLVVFAATFAMTAAWMAESLMRATTQVLLISGSKPVFNSNLVEWLQAAYFPVVQSLTPLVLALIVVSIAANLFQIGPIFTTHPIVPDFKRLNPMQTVKRLFSVKTVWELGKLLVKLMLLAALCYMLFKQLRHFVESIASMPPQQIVPVTLDVFIKTSIYVLLIIAVSAIIDLIIVQKEFQKKMRMSRRDLRDEYKRKDGDPEVKSKQKKLIRDLLKKAKAIPKTSEADVIITNPTHFAVAVQYRPKVMIAPIILAKGAGLLSTQIKWIAGKHQIPIIQSKHLARALYRECEIDSPVPEKLYAKLAPIYRWLYSKKNEAVGML